MRKIYRTFRLASLPWRRPNPRALLPRSSLNEKNKKTDVVHIRWTLEYVIALVALIRFKRRREFWNHDVSMCNRRLSSTSFDESQYNAITLIHASCQLTHDSQALVLTQTHDNDPHTYNSVYQFHHSSGIASLSFTRTVYTPYTLQWEQERNILFPRSKRRNNHLTRTLAQTFIFSLEIPENMSWYSVFQIITVNDQTTFLILRNYFCQGMLKIIRLTKIHVCKERIIPRESFIFACELFSGNLYYCNNLAHRI